MALRVSNGSRIVSRRLKVKTLASGFLTSLLYGALIAPPIFGQQVALPQSQSQSQSQPAPSEDGGLPVSLDRIREGLKKSDPLALGTEEMKADFTMRIIEQQKIDELLSKLNFKTGPAPAGGIYGYEQQRRVFSPTDRPLMQPYAAYNAGQFMTVALENLIASYVGKAFLKTLGSAMSGDDEQAAKKEVSEEIARYCARRPDRYEILLCTKQEEP